MKLTEMQVMLEKIALLERQILAVKEKAETAENLEIVSDLENLFDTTYDLKVMQDDLSVSAKSKSASGSKKIYCNCCETVQLEDDCKVHYDEDLDEYFTTCPNCKEVI